MKINREVRTFYHVSLRFKHCFSFIHAQYKPCLNSGHPEASGYWLSRASRSRRRIAGSGNKIAKSAILGSQNFCSGTIEVHILCPLYISMGHSMPIIYLYTHKIRFSVILHLFCKLESAKEKIQGTCHDQWWRSGEGNFGGYWRTTSVGNYQRQNYRCQVLYFILKNILVRELCNTLDRL